ncbi:MAG: RNA polymerase subunit sigma-70 [Cytophagaceae bacterium]|nr:RNA polymerase subunit sigma-70 [Cytophagaceae bacterium]
MKVISFFNNEKQLIKKCIEGNHEAQRRLYEQHSPRMLSVCRQYLKHIEKAEEAMCDGFLKIFENIESYRHEGSFEGWMRRIMVRTSIDHLRRESKLEFVDTQHPVEPAYNPNQNDLEVEHIQQLIDNLPEGYRAVFVLYAIEGYKHAEIADMLNISENTSKSQLFKARKMLQQKLEDANLYRNGTDKI